MPAELHFLHPGWLWALLPLGLLLVAVARARGDAGAWQRVVEPQLLAALTVGAGGGRRRWPLVLLGLGWLLAVLALANPTFERVSVPAFRDAAALVVVLDLSQSMLAGDLVPSRLERARFKVEDILRQSDPGGVGRNGEGRTGGGSRAGGQVGLVAFAGAAFAVAPLTDDAQTIRGMLDALSPEIMPVQGSRPDLGIRQALELLRQAGVQDGEVVLLTDDAGGARARAAAAELHRAGHRLAVIGVGTDAGAAVPGVRTAQGAVIARLDPGALRSLARHGGGDYARIAADDGDLRQVLPGDNRGAIRAEDKPGQVEIWQELGPWLALALVPLAALGFRRGWLLLPVLVMLQLGVTVPTPALAQQGASPAAVAGAGGGPGWVQRWRNLWQRRDQQAAEALARGAFERARGLAQHPARAGAASYRLGDFDAAVQAFSGGDSADAHYNRGNALARAGQLEEALAAYDTALEQESDMADALHNRRQVEEALRQRAHQSEQRSQQQDHQSDGSRQGQSSEQSSQSGDGAQDDNRQSGGPQASAETGQRDRELGQADTGAQADPSAEDAAPRDGEHDPVPQSAREDRAERTPGPEQQGAAREERGDDAGQQAGRDAETAAEAAQRRAAELRAAEDYSAEAAAAQAGGDESEDAAGTPAWGQALPDTAALETRRAADQWLRRIPDDPAGLLRRKFLYQYRIRGEQDQGGPAESPW